MHKNPFSQVCTLLEFVALVLPFFLSSFVINAQNVSLKFDYITVEQGLSQGQINCVFEDIRGYIWFGTKTGINRYDGNSVTVFKNVKGDDSSLSGNEITSIAEDKYGILWVSTLNHGVNLYDWKTEKFKRIMHDPGNPSSIGSNSINKVYIDKSNDHILLGTLSSGIDIFNRQTDSFEHLQFDELNDQSISSNMVYDIIKESDGRFWVATNFSGVDLLDYSTKTFNHVPFNPGQEEIIENWKKPLYKDSKGYLWVGGSNSAFRINTVTKEVTYFDPTSQLNSKMVTSFHEDHEGNVWIGTDGGGLNIYDPVSESFQYILSSSSEMGSLSSNAIYVIYQDHTGIVYVGTYNGGINSYHPNRYKFKSYKNRAGDDNSLSINFVLVIHEADDGKVWIGTDGGGLDLFDPSTNDFTHFKNSSNPNSISTNVITGIGRDNNNNIWLGTYEGGLNIYNPQTKKNKRFYH